MATNAADRYRKVQKEQLLSNLTWTLENLAPEDIAFLAELLIAYDSNYARQPLGLVNSFQLTINVSERFLPCRDEDEMRVLARIQQDLRKGRSTEHLKPVGSGWHLWINPKSEGDSSHA